MTRLKKLLKPRFLVPHLQAALPLMGEGSYLAVVTPHSLLAAAGDVPQWLGPDAVSRGIELPHVCVPLAFDDKDLGHLVAGPDTAPRRAPFDPLAIRPALDFCAASLTEILRREFGRRSLGEETLEQYRELALLQRATVNLNSSIKLLDVIGSMLLECEQSALPTNCGAIFLHDEDENGGIECAAAYGTLSRTDFMRSAKSALYKSIVRERQRGELVNALGEDERWGNEVPTLKCLMIVPMFSSGNLLGSLMLGSTDTDAEFKAAHLKRTETLASAAATALANARHFEQVQGMLTALVQSMATAIDSRDSMTAGHSHRVARYAMGLARAVNTTDGALRDMQFSESEQREIFFAGLLHDVGKIGVREEVLTKSSRLPVRNLELIGLRLAMWGQMHDTSWEHLLDRLDQLNTAYDLSEEDVAFVHDMAQKTVKVGERSIPVMFKDELDRMLTPRGNLTAEEWEEIKRHPAESHRILKTIPFTGHFPNLLTAVLHHHERLDGSGYPTGVSGDELSPQARILAIVDIYDSLRRDRHYKKALPQNMALNILREEVRVGKLDERLVQAFIDNIDTIEATLSQSGLPSALPLDLIQ